MSKLFEDYCTIFSLSPLIKGLELPVYKKEAIGSIVAELRHFDAAQVTGRDADAAPALTPVL
jgi:hypothetical protein